MKRGDIIQYIDMTVEEGFSMQRGMIFFVNGKDYGIILMSVRENAPYADRFEDDGMTIIYEGHDVQANFAPVGVEPKSVDQPMLTPTGRLTENGKFHNAAVLYKKDNVLKKIKVYEKIRTGVWVYNGYFNLTDSWIEKSNGRNVFKFRLEMIDEPINETSNDFHSELEIEHNRLIPTNVKVEVWQRDKGKCVNCGSNVKLHFDHIIPFSKGGSSTTAKNIQILCEKCNLKKRNNIE